MSARVLLAIASVLAAVAVISVSKLISSGGETGPPILMCPAPHSARLFADARDLCASRATALARIDGSGHVTSFTDPSAMPCGIPGSKVVSENGSQLIGHGRVRCDSDTAGTILYLFPHCSLSLNYTGNEDYRAALPIGLLVEPYDC